MSFLAGLNKKLYTDALAKFEYDAMKPAFFLKLKIDLRKRNWYIFKLISFK